MAALSPHWEAVGEKVRAILARLGTMEQTRAFYLAGGTALALRLGRRISLDLDLFGNVEQLDEGWRREMVAILRNASSIVVHQDSPMGLVLEVDGTAVGFYTYGYRLLAPTDEVEGVRIGGLPDIGLMKLDAIASRGLRKDFYDLYFIAGEMSLDDLFAASEEKFPWSRGFRMRVIKALVDFEIADREQDPILLAQVSWEQVKAFFVQESQRLGRKWLGAG